MAQNIDMGNDNIPPVPPAPLSYAELHPQPLPPQVGAWISQYAIWSLFAAVITIVLCGVVPHYGTLFRDFKMEIPAATSTLMAASDWYRYSHGWVFFIPVCLCMPPVIFLANGTRLRGEGTLISVRTTRRVLFLVAALWVAYTLYAVLIPYSRLIQTLGSRK